MTPQCRYYPIYLNLGVNDGKPIRLLLMIYEEYYLKIITDESKRTAWISGNPHNNIIKYRTL